MWYPFAAGQALVFMDRAIAEMGRIRGMILAETRPFEWSYVEGSEGAWSRPRGRPVGSRVSWVPVFEALCQLRDRLQAIRPGDNPHRPKTEEKPPKDLDSQVYYWLCRIERDMEGRRQREVDREEHLLLDFASESLYRLEPLIEMIRPHVQHEL